MDAQATDAVALFDRVVRARRAVRGFRPDPVPKPLLAEILDLARAAPSNLNSQPWRVYVLAGAAKDAFCRAVHQAYVENRVPPFSPFPQPPPPDTKARVEEFGRRLYGALGIERTDMAARARQTARNYLFFGAPVGLIFTIDAALTRHSWLDYGLFLQTLMLAAEVRGLATCAQVSFVRVQPIVAAELGLAPDELVTCGMSIGYADADAPVNHLDMPRESLDGFVRWVGFEE